MIFSEEMAITAKYTAEYEVASSVDSHILPNILMRHFASRITFKGI